jgi:hypothetical protein
VIGEFVKALSAKVTAALSEQGLPQLTDGVVQLGARFLDDSAQMPRVVMVPRSIDHGPPNPIAPSGAARRAQGIQRALWTRETTFDVHCFAASSVPDVWTEYDAVEYLADTVIWSVHQLVAGLYSVGSGDWADQDPPIQLGPQSHHVVFRLTVALPVTDEPVQAALAYVPAGTRPNISVHYPPHGNDPPEAP